MTSVALDMNCILQMNPQLADSHLQSCCTSHATCFDATGFPDSVETGNEPALQVMGGCIAARNTATYAVAEGVICFRQY